jgi:hypothetical protein
MKEIQSHKHASPFGLLSLFGLCRLSIEESLMVLNCNVFFLVVVGLFCVHKPSGRLCYGFCFWFGLVFEICLVVVVVVEAFFQHCCSIRSIGCGFESQKAFSVS